MLIMKLYKKLKKNNRIIEEMFNQLDDIRSLYNLTDKDSYVLYILNNEKDFARLNPRR